jgi:hypothetical protein
MDEKAVRRARREALRTEYGELYARVSAILFEEDPIRINFTSNTDEYEPEVDTILPRLARCVTVEDVRAVVHEEFVRWFNTSIAGAPERYTRIAERILVARG